MEPEKMESEMQEPGVDQQQVSLIEARLRLESQLRVGAGWFFWIAALSVINSVVLLVGGGWSFIIGLGATQVVDVVSLAIVAQAEPEIVTAVKVMAFVVDLSIAGVFVVFGMVARKRYTGIFMVGMVLYALDGLIFLLVQDYLSIGFHLFVLFGLLGGLRASRELNRLEQAMDSSEVVPGF